MLRHKNNDNQGQEQMADVPGNLEDMLKDAHLPALLTAMVHLTGDASWLRPEWTPVYNPMDREDLGISPEQQIGRAHV